MININPSQLLPPLPDKTDVITYTIKVNEEVISDQLEVMQIQVNRSFNRIPYAILRVLESDVSTQRMEVSDQDLLSPGNKIEVAVGYYSDETTIFKGIIIRHAIKVKSQKAPLIEIECKDVAVKMTVGRKNKYFFNKTDGSIIEEIAQSYKGEIQTEIKGADVEHPHMVQYFATDWDFVLTRADANALLVAVVDGKLFAQKPDFNQAAKHVFNYGSSLYEFEAEMDARDQYPAAKVASWNPAEQKVLAAEADAAGSSVLGGSGGLGGAISKIGNLVADLRGTGVNTDYTQVIGIGNYLAQHSGVFTNQELQAWASAQYQKSTLSKAKGRVRFDGVADIYPGDCMELQNVGLRHTGKVFVTAIKHEVQEGSWFTEAQFGLPHCWFAQEFNDIQDRPAADLLPGVCGLQIGVVTKIENDPEGEDRILVRMPLVDNGAEGVWARVASQDAGLGDDGVKRGAYFRPQTNDEVILGFLNDDPRSPIVLGMLHSSKNPSPITATSANNEKGWITRSGMKMLFDDEQKSWTVETPDGKKATVNDTDDVIQLEDQYGNKIIMGSDGITIDSASDLNLKAAGDVSLEGMNVNQKANQEMNIGGQSKAQVKAVGDVVIKGTFVKIN
ncbi:MAG: type VI secretion system tip protein VgrG [Bacteroidota bacterium]